MRLSDLIGRDVITTDGDALGHVHEALLVQDGPLLSDTTAAFRVHALAVGPRAFGTQLGYYQGTVTGPRWLRRVFHREPTIVPWNAIVGVDDEHIVVNAVDVASL